MYNLQKSLLILLVLFLVACNGDKKEDIPADILSVEQMATVMVDIHLQEASLNMNVYALDSTRSKQNPTFEVFQKNNITPERYTQSLTFYSNNLPLFNKVYQLVLIKLNTMQAALSTNNTTLDTVRTTHPRKRLLTR